MADDIDIEEHDVLESLRRRQEPGLDPGSSCSPSPGPSNLPDPPGLQGTQVKVEPLDIEYDPHYEESGNYEYQWEWDKEQAPQIKIEPHTEEFRFGKIIVGSKPATPPPNEENFCLWDGQENYNYNMSLVLDDWGPMLERSDCYCKECQILFATVNALDAHKMILHSFLIATDKEASPERNKAFKSTAKPSDNDSQQTCKICQYYFKGSTGKSNLLRHYRDVHKVDPNTLPNGEDFKSWRICNHCNMYFPDDTSLVKHLYQLLPLNNKTPTKDDRKVVQSAVKAKPVFKVDKSIHKDSAVDKHPNRIILGSKTVSMKSEKVDDVKPSESKWKCEICGIQYTQQHYRRHMLQFHPNIAEEPQTIPDKIVLNNTSVKFKCLQCNQILLTKYLAEKHRMKHPEIRRKKIIVKLVKSNKIVKPNMVVPRQVYKKETKVIKPELTEKQDGILVSKSTLFKCNRCSVHFLTCTGACQHSIVCETSSNIRDWACPKCQRVFKSAERTAHEFQHKVMGTNMFKVYVVYLEMIVRILCECPSCHVCFEEDKFWRHVSSGCQNDADSYYCKECRLPIDACSKANHDSKHKQGDFTKEDFIKIDYVTSQELVPKQIKTEPEEAPRKALKRKLEIPKVPVKQKKANVLTPFNLYYCSTCKIYVGSKYVFHADGKCKETKKRVRSFCKICGIFFSPKYLETHKKLHGRYPNLSLADFTFMRISDLKKMRPFLETYPCKACKVNFLNKWNYHVHKCGKTSGVHCQVCQKKIHKEHFKVHMQIHNYMIPGKPKPIDQKTKLADTISSRSQNDNSPKKQNLMRKETKSVTKLPDLLMKYESLTALWNILYLCATCDTFTDSYDKVVEHCQNHLTNMENYGVVIMKCQICDMKFDSECYKRHVKLHAGSKVITKKTFQILKYEPYDLFSDAWFDFIDLPDEQKSQIVNRSIYRENRCVKMRLIQQGPPEYTLYKCSKCLKCVAAETIDYHVKLANCLKANKHACGVCDMTFGIRHQCEQHREIHASTGLGLESFRVVAFNDPTDAETNTKIMSYDTDNHGSKSKISFVEEAIKPKSPVTGKSKTTTKSFVFYKCAECQLCQMHIKNLKKHICDASPKTECGKCGLLVNAKYINKHNLLHNKYSFSRKNVITKTVNKEGKVVNIIKQSQDKSKATVTVGEDKSKLYKCYCGLHFTSLKTIEKHYKMRNCSTVIREKCSQCNLVFDPIEVVNHLCKHHAQNQVKNFNIVTPNKKTLYKCGLCHVLFYSKEAAIPHKGKCAGTQCGKKCEKCGLAFDAASLVTHLLDHERNQQLRTDCYVIVQIPDNVEFDKKISNVLYKCKACDVHFLRRSSARNHLNIQKHGYMKPEKCKICKLGFLPKTMPKHVAWQHHKLKIKQFNVKELIVGVNTKLPKAGGSGGMLTKKLATKVEPAAPKTKPVYKIEPKPVQRRVTVYKCGKCILHFTDESSLVNHREDRCSKELSEECDDCAIKFASRNIKEHKKLHGFGVTLTMTIISGGKALKQMEKKEMEDKQQYPLDRYDSRLYKCTICDFHYNCEKSLKCHQRCNPDTVGVKCDICDRTFTQISLTRHTLIHKKYNFKKDDFVVLTMADLNSSQIKKEPEELPEEDSASLASSLAVETPEDAESTKLKAKEPKASDTHMLFKCAACNVYFVTQRACHKHVAQHTPFDCKDYIECKLCGFQFTIMSLPNHIKKHHAKSFNLEEVLVEEYQPNDVKSFESYYASEKDQSSLVSTSDDVKNVTNLKEDNDSEVTSCNQIVESVFREVTPVNVVTDGKTVSDQESNSLKVTTEINPRTGNVDIAIDGTD